MDHPCDDPAESRVPSGAGDDASTEPVGVLEIGGSHVTSAVVCGDHVASIRRRGLRPDDGADNLIRLFAAAIAESPAPAGAPWVVAIPGPFDYARGVGRFAGVGKFDSLNGVAVGRRLRGLVAPHPLDIHFVNDADAFAIGAWYTGGRVDRCVAITVGSGIGSTFLERGWPVTVGPTVPPDGELHLTRLGDLPLEEVVSRRAILRRYRGRAAATPEVDVKELDVKELDVKEIVDLARGGDAWAAEVCRSTFEQLGRALDPWLRAFAAQELVVGGGMAAGWDVIGPALAAGLVVEVAVRRPSDPELCALIGAAIHLRRRRAVRRT